MSYLTSLMIPELMLSRLQHHLALISNRSFAYEPLVQDETVRLSFFTGDSQSLYKEIQALPFELKFPPWRSARIPLSAMVATVISGFEKFYDVPRAIP